jgi:hypothetical protein
MMTATPAPTRVCVCHAPPVLSPPSIPPFRCSALCVHPARLRRLLSTMPPPMALPPQAIQPQIGIATATAVGMCIPITRVKRRAISVRQTRMQMRTARHCANSVRLRGRRAERWEPRRVDPSAEGMVGDFQKCLGVFCGGGIF